MAAVGYPLAVLAGFVAGNVWHVVDIDQTIRNTYAPPYGTAYSFGWSACAIAVLSVALVTTAALAVSPRR
jgi:hypothetical protein